MLFFSHLTRPHLLNANYLLNNIWRSIWTFKSVTLRVTLAALRSSAKANRVSSNCSSAQVKMSGHVMVKSTLRGRGMTRTTHCTKSESSLVQHALIIQTQHCTALIEGDLSICLQQTPPRLFTPLSCAASNSSADQNWSVYFCNT